MTEISAKDREGKYENIFFLFFLRELKNIETDINHFSNNPWIRHHFFWSEIESIVSVNTFDSSKAGLLQCKRNIQVHNLLLDFMLLF